MRVSIGIPFLNNEKTLPDAIRSVFAQSFRDWELILVNDGSSDRSLEIASSIQDSRVRVINDGKNMGLSNRLNQITKLAKGEYIARMDGDDLMHPERLQRQVEYLDAHPEVDLVGTGVYSIDSNNYPQGIRSLEWIETQDMIPKIVLFNNKKKLLIHPTVTGRLQWFLNNPYDEYFVRTEDLELWLRTYKNSLFQKIQEPLLFYRESNINNVDRYLKKYLFSNKMIRDRLLKKYGNSTLGSWGNLLQILSSYLKDETYRLFTFLGIQNWLISSRNFSSSLNKHEKETAQKIIIDIVKTKVPGLDLIEKEKQDA